MSFLLFLFLFPFFLFNGEELVHRARDRLHAEGGVGDHREEAQDRGRDDLRATHKDSFKTSEHVDKHRWIM